MHTKRHRGHAWCVCVSSQERPPVPWFAMFTSVPYLASVFSAFCYSWGWYMLLTELPTYMNNILHFDIDQVSDQQIPTTSKQHTALRHRPGQWSRPAYSGVSRNLPRMGINAGGRLVPITRSLYVEVALGRRNTFFAALSVDFLYYLHPIQSTLKAFLGLPKFLDDACRHFGWSVPTIYFNHNYV